MGSHRLIFTFAIVSLLLITGGVCVAGELRIGIIGTDTSHVSVFSKVLNDANDKNHVEGGRVVAAFKGGSKDIPASADRVDKYAAELQDKYGVKLVDSIEDLCKQVDAVMLESVDGRPHLEQARPVIKAGKRLFIDKPLAVSLADGLEIFRLANEANVPVFSSSSLRFGKTTQAVRRGIEFDVVSQVKTADGKTEPKTVHYGPMGKVLSAVTMSPVNLEPHHPELFWYGVHGVESLFTVMGPGCVSVKRSVVDDGKTIEVVGTWADGRTGTFRQSKTYGGTAKCEKGEAPVGGYDGYAPLLVEVIKFFQTGVSPVPQQETIEILQFMEASDESKRQDGKEVRMADVLKKAQTK